MSSDEATDLLEHLPKNAAQNLLTLMESARAKKLSALLGYSSDSAGGLMTTEYAQLLETLTVENAIEYVKTQTASSKTCRTCISWMTRTISRGSPPSAGFFRASPGQYTQGGLPQDPACQPP